MFLPKGATIIGAAAGHSRTVFFLFCFPSPFCSGAHARSFVSSSYYFYYFYYFVFFGSLSYFYHNRLGERPQPAASQPTTARCKNLPVSAALFLSLSHSFLSSPLLSPTFSCILSRFFICFALHLSSCSNPPAGHQPCGQLVAVLMG